MCTRQHVCAHVSMYVYMIDVCLHVPPTNLGKTNVYDTEGSGTTNTSTTMNHGWSHSSLQYSRAAYSQQIFQEHIWGLGYSKVRPAQVVKMEYSSGLLRLGRYNMYMLYCIAYISVPGFVSWLSWVEILLRAAQPFSLKLTDCLECFHFFVTCSIVMHNQLPMVGQSSTWESISHVHAHNASCPTSRLCSVR